MRHFILLHVKKLCPEDVMKVEFPVPEAGPLDSSSGASLRSTLITCHVPCSVDVVQT